MDHLNDCIDRVIQNYREFDKPKTVFMAILHHNFMYDPHREDNEEMSARYTSEICRKLEKSELFIKDVEDLIRTTVNKNM